MNLFIIAGIVGILVILLGVFIAGLFFTLSRLVNNAQIELEAERTAVNPSLTFGYELPVKADVPVQLREARKLAAKRAAALPRGANMRIGRLGASNLRPASKALEEDPWTAVKIAAFHTWQGAKVGPPVGGAPQQAPAAARAATAAPTKKPEDLVPGVDYPFIEVTDDMDPAEVRKARIANARARSAAIKALREQTPAAAPAADTPAGEPVVAEMEKASPAAEAIAEAGVPAPDYVEITDDMAPDEVRKARIHNARARSAYHKALKEAGVEPRDLTQRVAQPAAAPAATEASPQATTPAEPTPASGREAVAVPDDVLQPDYIEITDDMPDAEVRKARIHNARERSRYYKTLKERGIDPKAVEAGEEATATAPTPAAAPEPAAEPAAAPEPAAAAQPAEIPAHIPRPDYVEISDDMDADEVRRARIHNARERSAFARALKEAGIDPKSVDL